MTGRRARGAAAAAARLVEFSRPFTLLPPLLGFLAGAAVAAGAAPPPGAVAWIHPVLGAVMAALLNAASNGLNQICDVEIDRIAKPGRPLPSGRLGRRTAWAFTLTAWALALSAAWFVSPDGARECFLIVLAGSLFVWMYSAPPLRVKRLGMLANVTIAVPRGLLLTVAGWSSVRGVLSLEPWLLGLVFGLFLLGAATTKDFADIEADRAGGCRTLPVIHGPRGAAKRIAPFFVAPFLLLPAGVRLGLLSGDPLFLDLLGAGLAVYGAFAARVVLRRAGRAGTDGNRAVWRHMYLLMMTAQFGLAAAYLL